ncbi:MAG: SGNH/GDSL hydrolase family protein [Promethearchaeota archaeon]
MIFICIGDSLTAGSPGFSGYGRWAGNIKSQYEYWVEKLIEKDYPEQEVEIINCGVGGDRVFQIYQRYYWTLLKSFPEHTHVVVWIGINDLVGGSSPSRDVIQNIESFYDLVDDNGKEVIAVEIAPVTLPKLYLERVREVNLGINGIARKRGYLLVPLFDSLLNDDKNGLNEKYDIGDGVHFNIKGYEKIGQVIYEHAIRKVLERKYNQE